jgi:hypothetical protein
LPHALAHRCRSAASTVLASIRSSMQRQEEEAVAQAVREKLKAAVETEHNYRSILAFTAFMVLYLGVLWLQASAFRTSEVVSTLRELLLPGGSTTASFGSSDEVLDWIEEQLVTPFWRDPQCGDGSCEQPFEFPAWGRFGCSCGVLLPAFMVLPCQGMPALLHLAGTLAAALLHMHALHLLSLHECTAWHDMAWHGMAWHGMAGQGRAGQTLPSCTDPHLPQG